MKDTPQVRKCVQEIASYYADKLKLTPKEVPDIFFDGITLPNKKDTIFHSKKHYAKYIYGGISLIYLNLKPHTSVRGKEGLVDTIVHELIHIKYPNLKHGDKFEQKIQETLCECK